MRLSLIWAMTENGVIGRDQKLPWSLPDEMAHFRRTTLDHPIIMGRKTFESHGCKPFPRRKNIVLTSSKAVYNGVWTVKTVSEAIDVALQGPSALEEVFVIGGSAVYRSALPQADRLYCTIVHANLAGDVQMDVIDFNAWKLRSQAMHPADDRHAYSFTMFVFDRGLA